MTKKSQCVSAGIIADWLGLSVRRVRELASTGIVVKGGRDRYDLKASVTNYAKNLREQAAGRVGVDKSTDIAAANVRWKEFQARLSDLRYEREAGRLIEVDVVRKVWDPIMRGIVQRTLALPGKFAFEIPTLSRTDRSIMDRIIRDDLTDASLGNGFDFSDVDDHNV